MEVCNSFEINHKEVDGKIQIDMDYFEVKREQCMPSSGFRDVRSCAPSRNVYASSCTLR